MQHAASLLRSRLDQLCQHPEQPKPAREAELPPVGETDPPCRGINRFQADRDHHTSSVPANVPGGIGHLTDGERSPWSTMTSPLKRKAAR